MIWQCHCGAEGLTFYPGSEPDVVPGLEIVVARGESARTLCEAHFRERYGANDAVTAVKS
jgi:hypothetical protein